ncbi:MAG: adenylosuccinate lyase [Crocinitomicaceae bacterium]|jgi:adenylosuccinate lyase|nr:adenylosuccinate lyase [Crocinitomicaceae bacterium]MDP4723546.1 adenylosuccinate lyase [Crocinitomicaceae bacterium]MDP4799934.1 adenylosuccinate lyase [Crocinitomicaceae bacterium]MDP4805606.1 adenylosuccinate lyase [Crocinitomicaceae bacterium]MDP4867372.1 adenylosuccinate lyase [Crocinitomicaceae bacterium]
MEFNALTAISPIDGRYQSKTAALQAYFSEYGLIRYRVLVEVEYLIALVDSGISNLSDFPKAQFPALRAIYNNFSQADALWIKETEQTTNHDVKAVEYFLKEKMQGLGLGAYLEFIHFGLTSQDINNTAIPLSLKEGIEAVYLPALAAVQDKLVALAQDWKDIPMLARTHGQPASPTRLGKEIQVFAERLDKQVAQLKALKLPAKFGGATGNFNAHFVAYPQTNWVAFGNHFVNDILGLDRSQTTTQIEHYDQLAAIFDCMKRINNIILDLDRDMWTYISMDYFKQQIKAGEIGSSAMPHKVNPIDFENSEGNVGLANALYEHLAAKLPVSRLQRDLTDSTVLRVVGVPLAHSVIAFGATLKGLGKLLLNTNALAADLENNWAVVAEAIQTILRREGFEKPYEALKGLTRKNERVTKESVHAFIDELAVSAQLKAELKLISPDNYVGVQLVD